MFDFQGWTFVAAVTALVVYEGLKALELLF